MLFSCSTLWRGGLSLYPGDPKNLRPPPKLAKILHPAKPRGEHPEPGAPLPDTIITHPRFENPLCAKEDKRTMRGVGSIS